MNESHSVAFIVRTKGFEDERIIQSEALTTSKLTSEENLNLLFNNALRIACHKERKFKDTYIFMGTDKLVACVKTNHSGKQTIYYYLDKPKYLFLIQRKIR